MRRPADCLDEAREFEAAKRDAPPAAVAQADQLAAQGAELTRRFTHVTAVIFDRDEAHRGMAFQIAASEAIAERLSAPEGVLCPHMVDPFQPHILSLTVGFVACPECAPEMEMALEPWDADRCDVCGEPALGFEPLAFTLGAGAAFANVCRGCWDFLDLGDEQAATG